MTSLDSFRALFRKRLAVIRSRRPDMAVTLHIGPASDFPAPRDYAYSAWDGRTCRIVFAPKIGAAPRSTQDALIRHELSHALLQSAGLEHSERECDGVAEEVFGDPIYYDENDVQTLDFGVRPRPSYLPNPGRG